MEFSYYLTISKISLSFWFYYNYLELGSAGFSMESKGITSITKSRKISKSTKKNDIFYNYSILLFVYHDKIKKS